MIADFSVLEKKASEKAVTIAKVANDLGFSPSTLYGWRDGLYQPKMDKIQKIAEYFGAEVWEFYK